VVAAYDVWVSTASTLGDVLLSGLALRGRTGEREARMTDDERTAPDCSGYVVVDHEHGEAVSVAPYSPPAPRAPADDETA
jgi:hypothetical protein